MWTIYSKKFPVFKGDSREDMNKLCKELNKKFGRKYTVKDEAPKPRNS